MLISLIAGSIALVQASPARPAQSFKDIQEAKNGQSSAATVSPPLREEKPRVPEALVLNQVPQQTVKPTVVKNEPVLVAIQKPEPVVIPEKPSDPKHVLMEQAGIPESEYGAVDYILTRESGWCAFKHEGEYGACPAYHGVPTNPRVGYGLCQSTPAIKMAAAGDDWATNPVTQLKWCAMHAKQSHGGWWNAFAFWQNKHWW